MKKRWLTTGVALAMVASLALSSVAFAANSAGNGAKTEIFELECDNGGVYVIAVSPGQWGAGRVIEVVSGPDANVLVPFSIEATFTPVEGEPETFSVSKPGPGPNELVTCTFGGEDEFGSFTGVVEAMLR